MKHTIRQHGQLVQIDCELGSGVLDKNGREIFEGDIVRFDNKKHRVYPGVGNGLTLVNYKNMGVTLEHLTIDMNVRNRGGREDFRALDVEVVGHVGV